MPNRQIRVDPRNLRPVKCPLCKKDTFTPAVLLRVVPKLFSPAGNDDLIAEQVYQCSYCQAISSIPELIEYALRGNVAKAEPDE